MTKDYIGIELFSGAIAHVSPDIKPEMLEALRELIKLLKVNFTMEGLTEGRIVHYVMLNGQHRPAIVVKVWRNQDGTPTKDGYSNRQVFTDSDAEGKYNDGCPPVMWATSVPYSEEPRAGTWHWIEKA